MQLPIVWFPRILTQQLSLFVEKNFKDSCKTILKKHFDSCGFKPDLTTEV